MQLSIGLPVVLHVVDEHRERTHTKEIEFAVAAVVTGVNPDGTVNLRVFRPANGKASALPKHIEGVKPEELSYLAVTHIEEILCQEIDALKARLAIVEKATVEPLTSADFAPTQGTGIGAGQQG